MANIPFLDLKAQWTSIRDEIQMAIDRVLQSQHFILGPEVEALEREIADYSQCRFGIGVSSGTDALLVSLMAIGLQPGDEVITTPYTFFATVGSIVRLGARPVFVDIDPSSYNINPTQIEAAISQRTRAIIPVHLFGQMAEMDPILEVARRHKLYVIEDAAQAIGSEYKGCRAGSMGHFGCFSFFPSKNLGGCGDGGMVVTSDEELADRVRLLRNHGHQPKYYNRVVGGNFRLDALQAAILRVKLRHLNEWTQGRRRNAALYNDRFTRTAASEAHSSQDQTSIAVELPCELPGHRHVYNQFVIRTGQRDRLISGLKRKGIGCEIYYPLPMHLQECFRGLGYPRGDFPESEGAAEETLALPIYPELTQEMLSVVVKAVTEVLLPSDSGLESCYERTRASHR